MAAYSSAGGVPLVTWAATVEPADVPIMRSAPVTSTPACARPAIRPSSQALPAAPPPARTRARRVELLGWLGASTGGGVEDDVLLTRGILYLSPVLGQYQQSFRVRRHRHGAT